MISRKAASFFLLLALFCLPFLSTRAQGPTTGRLSGTVKDPNGAAVPGATVTVINVVTGNERKVTTDSEGSYTAPALPPGLYHVSIVATGFKTLIGNVQVTITQTTVEDAHLEVGDLKESVPISGTPRLIQRDGPQLGRVVDSRSVSELPLATRNFTQILGLSPGTAVDLPDNTTLGRNPQNISVNGARTTQNNYQLNGVDGNNIRNNNFQGLLLPAPETIQDFKVQASLYDASFGRSGGGNIQAVTRSGANDFHGAA